MYQGHIFSLFCILLQIFHTLPSEGRATAFLVFFTLNVYRHTAPCFHKPPNLIAITHIQLTMQEKCMLTLYKSS